MTAPDARPERDYNLEEAAMIVRSRMEGDAGEAADLVNRLIRVVRKDAESRLREVEAERDRWHSLVKSLCDEWNDECPPGCDSYAHEDDCGATSITVAMRKRGEEIAALRAERDALVPLAKCAVSVLDYFKAQPSGATLAASEELRQYIIADRTIEAARAILDRLGKEGAAEP